MAGKTHPRTVDEYLAGLTEDRRAAIEAVRKVVLSNLDADFEEGVQYGMIGYYIPHRVYPPGYHCDPKQPLPFAGLASQKNYMSLYLMCVYGAPEEEARFRAEWKKTGKKLDMGKSCVRFKKVDDLALDVIAQTVRRARAKKVIAHYEAAIRPGTRKTAKSGKRGPAKKAAKTAKPKPKAAARPRKAAKKAVKKAAKKTVAKKVAEKAGR